MQTDMTIYKTNENPETANDSTDNVLVKYFGAIREFAGKSDESFDLISGSVVHVLLCRISDIYGVKMRAEIFDAKNINGLRDDLMVTLNEAILNHSQATGTVLKSGDTVALFPIFPGGG